MKKYILFLLSILFIVSSCNVSEKITTSIKVDIIPREEVDTSQYLVFYPHGIKVSQMFKIRNFKQDTLLLKLDHKSVYSRGLLETILHYQKIKITDIKSNANIAFDFSKDGIKLSLPSENSNIEVEYLYQPDYVLGGDPNGGDTKDLAPLTRVIGGWHSWYFTVPNMKFEEVRFNVPPNRKFFVSRDIHLKKDNEYYIDCKNIEEDKAIDFAILEPNYYEVFKIDLGKNNFFDVYAFKGVRATNDFSSYAAAYTPKDTILNVDKYHNYILAVSKVQDFFGKNISASIIDGTFAVASANFGMAFPTETHKNSFVLMDTSFWQSSGGLHEMVHLYNDVYPSEKNKGLDFFKESMTEFLAVYFYYKSPEELDSAFNSKIKYCNDFLKENKSIFSGGEPMTYHISSYENASNRDFGDDYGVIIQRAPYKLYILGKSVGLEKFMNILSRFYKEEVNKNPKYDFDTFRKFLLNNGVSQGQWDEFEKGL